MSRYIHQWKKQMRQDGVNEDDLLEIKQDISSLRLPSRFIHSPFNFCDVIKRSLTSVSCDLPELLSLKSLLRADPPEQHSSTIRMIRLLFLKDTRVFQRMLSYRK